MTKAIPVTLGQKVVLPAGWPVEDREYVVQSNCDLKNQGLWGCVTHREVFANNLQASIHEDDNRKHVVVWFCYEHGPEVP